MFVVVQRRDERRDTSYLPGLTAALLEDAREAEIRGFRDYVRLSSLMNP